MSIPVNFSNSWPRSSYWKHYIWKKLWSSTPEKWNVEGDLKKTRQKKSKNIAIKQIRVKIIRKNKLKGNNKFLILELNWKE
jgi:hypothetical protein